MLADEKRSGQPVIAVTPHNTQRVDELIRDDRQITTEELFLGRIVTGDETWAHFFEPESKRQSMEWSHTTSPKKKKNQNCTIGRESYGDCVFGCRGCYSG